MSIGYHCSKNNRLMSVALREEYENLRGYGLRAAPCFQIFVTGPQSNVETIKPDDKLAVRAQITELGLQVVIHGAYIDNPWGGARGSVRNIKAELEICNQIGAVGVIVHLGKGASALMSDVLGQISALPRSTLEGAVLFFEINAAKPTPHTFETPEKLVTLFARIFEWIDRNGSHIRPGLTIDTAHLFSLGVSLSTCEAAERWLRALKVGFDSIRAGIPIMIHLNDSAAALGSGIDRHEKLTFGGIWSPYNIRDGHLPIERSGLMTVLRWAEENRWMVILERYESGLASDLSLVAAL